MTRPGKIPVIAGIEPRFCPSPGGHLNHLANEAVSRAEDARIESRFPRLSHASDLDTSTPVSTQAGAWRCRVSTKTGRPVVSKLRLGEVTGLICSFCICVAAHRTSLGRSDLQLLYLCGSTQN